MSFKDKVVLITGASSGIGAATAIEFAKEDANVVIVGRNTEKLQKVAAECAKYGRQPLLIKADIGVDDEAKTMVDQVIEEYGRLDVLVNNAGLIYTGSVLEGNMVAAYDKTMNVNVRAHVNVTTLAARHLVKTKGNIINISSVGGSSATRIIGGTPYCVSKAALNHFTRCAAKELAAEGVRVNSISPGPVITDFMENAGFPDAYYDDVAKQLPLKRVSKSEEVAFTVLFLASDKAIGITGSDFIADNGYLL